MICRQRLSLIGALLVASLSASVSAENNTPGTIRIDGSSTVFPVTEAVAEEFGRMAKDIKVTVGISGTGGGFKKFCAGETEVQDASRPIKPVEEEMCKSKGITYIELPIAYDALTVVVNPRNTWATSITVSELKKMWEPEAQAKVNSWNQIRAGWPDRPLKLYGPGVDSGTFDYYTEAIVGKEDSSRGDFTSSEDDNVLVQGVAGDLGALGYFGLAYYLENAARLKAVAIDAEKGKGPIAPSPDTVMKGEYNPLSRPLFIYVRKDLASRADLESFVRFYLKNAGIMAKEVGYIPLRDSAYELSVARFEKRIEGSAVAGKSLSGTPIEDLLKQ